jgi:hypothetical protein
MQLAAPGLSLGPIQPTNLRNAVHPNSKCRQTRAAQAAVITSTYPSLYIAKFPLAGFEIIENLPPLFSNRAALHVAVIIECSENGTYWLFDFLPENPTDPIIAARVLSNLGVPGQARTRQLKKLPRQRCSLAGTSKYVDAIERARTVQEQWNNSELKLFKRDCRHFVDALVLELT